MSRVFSHGEPPYGACAAGGGAAAVVGLLRARGRPPLAAGPTEPAPERAKTGLVIQGGAMRGVFTAGALCALEAMGLRAAFDSVYGSSAGAVNGAYFLADQVTLGTSIYYTEINNRRFIDWRRLLAGTAVDIDFCYDEVVGRRKPLALERVLASRARLHIYVTNADQIATECFTQHELPRARDLLTLLKASAAMPLVYRRPVLYAGTRYVDGALFTPVPLLEAIADGCTHILVLLSRPLATAAATPQGFLMPLVLRSIDWRAGKALAQAWGRGQEQLRRSLELLRNTDSHLYPQKSTGEGVHLAVVAPPPDLRVSRFTADASLLIAAAVEAARRTLALFGIAEVELSPLATLGPEAAAAGGTPYLASTMERDSEKPGASSR